MDTYFTNKQFFQIKAVAVIISCDITTSETKKVVKLACRFQETMPIAAPERTELYNLIVLARNINPRYTAADFFNLNRTTLFALLSVTTTYFIIIIQFNLQPQ